MEVNKKTWIKVLEQYLGEAQTSYFFDDLLIKILSVDQGVKPAFLWDEFQVHNKEILALFQTLHSKQLISNPLVIVDIETDVFILNLNTLTRVIIEYLTSSHSWLIDISKQEAKVASAAVHNSFKKCLCSILRQLGVAGQEVSSFSSSGNGSNNECSKEQQSLNSHPGNQSGSESSSNCLSASNIRSDNQALNNASEDAPTFLRLHLPEESNVSSVFGCLLGQPQIYWWDSESTGSNLSGMALKVYEFTAQFPQLFNDPTNDDDNKDDVILFSFSVPESLEAELKTSIQLWGNIVNARVERSSLLSQAKFNCDPVLCLQVAL